MGPRSVGGAWWSRFYLRRASTFECFIYNLIKMAEPQIKYLLLKHYLGQSDCSQIQTVKDLQDFATQHSFDFAKVKACNLTLLHRGLIKERKKPILYYQVVREVETRLEEFFEEIRGEVEVIREEHRRLSEKLKHEETIR
jgi:hypothetical protein